MNWIEHLYGPQVHLLNSTYLNALLAKLCHPDTHQPEINRWVESLYKSLLIAVINSEFPTENFRTPTRMTETHPEVFLTGSRIKSEQRVICINLARAGTFPSHICYDFLHNCISPQSIRQDHIFAARSVGLEHQVTGTDIGATKIGGDKEDAIVLIPDPMGATGNTILATMDYYQKKVPGRALKFIALHLIVTPEYLRKVTSHYPEVQVYALRLDRGLSAQAVLDSKPGLHWDQEKGLNSKDYIVPGGGGFGEIMNNSFV